MKRLQLADDYISDDHPPMSDDAKSSASSSFYDEPRCNSRIKITDDTGEVSYDKFMPLKPKRPQQKGLSRSRAVSPHT